MKSDITRSTHRPEQHYSSVLMQQGRVQLDADWNEQMAIQAHLDATTRSDVIGLSGAPEAQAGFAVYVKENTIRISAGHYYVDGLLGENDKDVEFTAQPDLPDFSDPTEPGLYLAYLDIWQRHITAVEDPDIREVALGGPDTSTRTKTVCQVKLLRVGDVDMQANRFSTFHAWDVLVAPSAGRLRARAKPQEPSDQPCILPPGAGYQRLENQLYRVEIHTGGAPGTATFKWSRDNGSVVAHWLDQNGIDLTVRSLGRDSALGFASGQWVELIDDTRELNGEAGILVELAGVNGQVLTINPATATAPVERADFAKIPKVRLWNSLGARGVSVSAQEEVWIPLEDGVEVKFEGNDFKTGEYWLISARTATGDVEWPRDISQQPLPRVPDGIVHHYCRLALLTFKERSWTVTEDCRQLFPALSQPGVHITAVRTKDPEGTLRHDMSIRVEVLVGGLEVECDTLIDSTTISQPTCFVTLDMPTSVVQERPQWGGNPVIGFQPLVVAGSLTSTGREISWQVERPAREWLQSLPAIINSSTDQRIRARLTLKGHYIWAADNPHVYLDGETFGTPSGALRLPSGDSRRGGDFEMWFWLVAEQPSVTLEAVTLTQAAVPGGTPLTGTVTLSGTAPAGGLTVALSSAPPAVATVPPTVSVAVGQTSSAPFEVTTTPVAQDTLVTITATRAGGSEQPKATLQVRNPRPLAVTLSTEAAVPGGTPLTGTVTLSGAAPAGGLTVALSSAPPAVATVPPTVSVAAGQTSSEAFAVTTTPVAQDTLVTITATYAGGSERARLGVRSPRPLAVTLTPTTVPGGTPSGGTVTLSGAAPAGGLTVTLSSDPPAVATVPETVPVRAGQTSSEPFEVTTNPVTQPRQVTIIATHAGGSARARLAVTPSPVRLVEISNIFPDRIGLAGQRGQGTVTLSGPAPAGGLTVALESSNTQVATVPPTVPVGPGQTSASFEVPTRRVTVNTGVTITARHAEVELTQQLAVVTRRLSLTAMSVRGGGSLEGRVSLSVPAPTGGLVIRLSNSNPAVATVPATVTVAAGQLFANFPITTVTVTQNTRVSIAAEGARPTQSPVVYPPVN